MVMVGVDGLELVLNGTPTDNIFATGSSASFQIAVDVGDVLDLNYLNTGTWGGRTDGMLLTTICTLLLTVDLQEAGPVLRFKH